MNGDKYSPPRFLFNGHIQTIYPSLFRKVNEPVHVAERIVTPDEDFLDLFWSNTGSEKLVIISHGLEGNAQRQYITGMANACLSVGYDVIRWNFRGCGPEMNKQLRFYHSGATDDLDTLINHALTKGYKEINLIGFSLGGNMMLKYLGEDRDRPQILNKAVAISVPMDLFTSCRQISRPSNWIYSNRFIKSLKNKVKQKAQIRTDLDIKGIASIKTLIDFDNRYTAPLHGYKDALDYYSQCSSLRYVENISVKTLIVNAQNDPFLSPECYPHTLLKNHQNVKFESPSKGGHVGFTQFSKNGLYWSEERAIDFLSASYL